MASVSFIAQAFDWRGPLESSWESVATFVPKFIGFLLILLIGRIIAGVVRKLVSKALAAIRFDAAMDRAGIGGPLERAGFDDSARFVALLIYYAILLLALQLALGVFGPNPVQDALSGILAYIPKLIVGIAIIILTGFIANVVRQLLAPMFANMTAGDLLGRWSSLPSGSSAVSRHWINCRSPRAS